MDGPAVVSHRNQCKNPTPTCKNADSKHQKAQFLPKVTERTVLKRVHTPQYQRELPQSPKECTAIVTPLVELTAPPASSRHRLTNQSGAMHRITNQSGAMHRITKQVEYLHRITNKSGAMHRIAKGVEYWHRIANRSGVLAQDC